MSKKEIPEWVKKLKPISPERKIELEVKGILAREKYNSLSDLERAKLDVQQVSSMTGIPTKDIEIHTHEDGIKSVHIKKRRKK
jgi:hypothetical protein